MPSLSPPSLEPAAAVPQALHRVADDSRTYGSNTECAPAPAPPLAHAGHADEPTWADDGPLFARVVSVVDRTAAGHVARQHAALLGAGGEVEHVSAPRSDRTGSSLLDRTDGADLLVLGADDAIDGVMARASLPVLVARGSADGTSLTDRILLAVEAEPDPQHAAGVAARIASRHRSDVTVVPIPEPNRALDRATSATRRIVTQLAGFAPDVSGRPVRGEQAILSAVSSTDASLLVLPLGKTAGARRRAALLARLVGCSVLAVPAPSE